ncbi:unannotated protein [freshwater metagenome]|uniref:Unannotated protein n=1 Tax=freshwater metagenome TaxID=449393 RepID=A0A6J6GA07_9ZZZZ
MFTRSPLVTPSDFRTLANFFVSSSNCEYEMVRVSPGSPSQWMATLSPRPAKT